jgi:predicted nuclease of predicted toxin-antitoxin system
MRLLFDEHLSERLPGLLADVFPGSLHVRQIGLGGSTDQDVWEAAATRDCLLVTKDEDFHRLSVLREAPPRVVWIRLGNCTTDDVIRLLHDHASTITSFAEQDEAAFLALGAVRAEDSP